MYNYLTMNTNNDERKKMCSFNKLRIWSTEVLDTQFHHFFAMRKFVFKLIENEQDIDNIIKLQLVNCIVAGHIFAFVFACARICPFFIINFSSTWTDVIVDVIFQ